MFLQKRKRKHFNFLVNFVMILGIISLMQDFNIAIPQAKLMLKT